MNGSPRQWDVVRIRINPHDGDEHPAIVLSPNEISLGRADRLNVLLGSSKRPGVDVLSGQILLDQADGCEHLTVFDCVFFPVVRKASITAILGSVSVARRRKLYQTLSAALRLYQ